MSPIFGSFTSSPSSQSSGISSVVQIVLNRSYSSISMDVCPPTFKASGGMLSDPAAFPFLSLVFVLFNLFFRDVAGVDQ